MIQILLATSKASQSEDSQIHDFFSLSGMIRDWLWPANVKSFFTALFLWCSLALTSTMNTSVLLSPIFFMTGSVVRGNLIMEDWSSLFPPEAFFRGYLVCLQRCSVLCHKVVMYISSLCVAANAFQHYFLAFKGFLLALAVGGAGASFFTFGTIFLKKLIWILPEFPIAVGTSEFCAHGSI